MTLPDFSALHLLRPDWLWALSLLPALMAMWMLRRRRTGTWREAVDPHLLPHLLDGGDLPRRRWSQGAGVLIAGLAYGVTVLALAGPSWRQVEQPLWQGRQPLMVALDLSSATLAADPPPTRLAQAQAKLATLLASRDGPVGLLVFADDAFTVAPITDDVTNVALFLDALSPDIMPVDSSPAEGPRADRAIGSAVRLMEQAGFEQGRILLLAGDADARTVGAAADAHAAGFEVEVLGLGRSGGVTYRDVAGRAALAPFDEELLRRIAAAGGGRYARLSAGDADLRTLGVFESGVTHAAASGAQGGSAPLDEGFWLLPPLMLLMLLAFRRGAVLAVLMLGLWLPSAPAKAADWWRRADQVEHRRLSEATEAYRSGDYAAAAEGYAKVDSADGQYNLGNAMAKAGRYQEAIDAYDRALQLQPGMEDAVANRAAVEAAMKRQPQSGDESQPSDNDDGSQDSDTGGESPKQGPADPSRQPDAGDAQGQPTSPRDQGDSPESGSQDGAEEGEDGQSGNPPAEAPDAQDAQAQQAADEAQRQRMQQALEQDGREGEEEHDGQASGRRARPDETPAERERRIANEAWLRRVPDDPGGLLREKFRIEHERRQRQGGLGEPKP
ncbi:tetratricopeptide repeat protein [Marilutibacter chinensis]|uniref:Tetratricopeptide repeat protein n=1 Tax=Marilutibacter chinensis TaxID=2912247 RepID=A0ABS9HY95_9GAMM|nr:tetratricopeptide repeat protein [Lysobacter chinensis]MCF7223347.1 tetratricopeptide repeat protein [Lysobacter chinensis]